MTNIQQVHLEATICHVLGQMTNYYIPLPRVDLPETKNLAQYGRLYSSSDWNNVVEYYYHKPGAGQVWPKVVDKRRVDLGVLSSKIYDNYRWISDYGGTYVTYYSELYPWLLKQIPSPPVAFSVVGDTNLLLENKVGLIGARKASSLALKRTAELSKFAVNSGYVVVSGGAFGCDIKAHCSAVNLLGRYSTIVVFAGGLAKLYPRYFQRQYDEIKSGGGLLLSERLWDACSRPMDFPVRNRIIAGMVQDLFVMQAAERSGARLTANLAIDYGREIFVLKHEECDVRAKGGARLIEDGAISFENISDIEEIRRA